jgi:aspartate racemase
MIDLVSANRLGEITDYVVEELQRLARAGADFGILAANTPHIVFDEIQRRSPIPLISIVEATCAEAKKRGIRKAGLLGTRFTMQAQFYPDVFFPGRNCVGHTSRRRADIHSREILG